MITYEEAIAILVAKASGATKSIRRPVAGALGDVLAENAVSDVDLPPFDKAMMDGFALRKQDIATVPKALRVVGDIPAGVFPNMTIGEGECAAIMTGAPVPPGATAVVKVEDTSGFGEKTVTIHKRSLSAIHISPQSEIIKAGDVVLPAGTEIGVEEIALLAAVGCDPVPVFAPPKVAILATGDELIPSKQKPGPAQIRNSNSPALTAFLETMRVEVHNLGCVGDQPARISDAVSKGLEYDILFLSGGVSAGEYDHVEDVLAALDATIHFSKVAVKPGKPTLFATKANTAVLGLPGNPVSAMVIARLFGSILIDKYRGKQQVGPKTVTMTLASDISKKPGRLWFVPGSIISDDVLEVSPVDGKGSADITAAVRADCLIMAPKNVSHLPAGTSVEVVVWERSCRCR